MKLRRSSGFGFGGLADMLIILMVAGDPAPYIPFNLAVGGGSYGLTRIMLASNGICFHDELPTRSTG
ncbi:MAG: hypothetical protein A2W18_03720 [Candidatus Muproteobacteria bacterium RBG_16_60_9]|uniref:Uncharacterized protein n=1 Tax=Candidatus Muproteobacteria bacterium RBG_16_60_9 TaxID=1817755 RepID=A0A1F6UY36_9PROT|nr:MAG: hypothetical protein A2W18_03720 [Candidatus Muproteobacteria bacterium RBG_16_60_9]